MQKWVLWKEGRGWGAVKDRRGHPCKTTPTTDAAQIEKCIMLFEDKQQ
jgi:hypothetical protein